MTWSVILLEIAIRRCVHYGNEGGGHGIILRQGVAPLLVRDPKCAKKIPHTPLQHQHSLIRLFKGGWIHVFMLLMPISKFLLSKICPSDANNQATFEVT